ncbi:MAG: prepilin-type N-terminal cleavage/methylation domain-containing protein [Acidiferrobacterales bacterium]
MTHRAPVRNPSGRTGKAELPSASGPPKEQDRKVPAHMITACSRRRDWSDEAASSHPLGRKQGSRGFTLIELLIVVAMIGTLIAIGIPVYRNALDKAKLTKAIADIHTFNKEIFAYQLFNSGPPDTLAAIGRANWRDPYGNPYEYLSYALAKKSKKWGGTKAGTEKPRKDKFLKPLNSSYDLYSKGKDGLSKESLNAKESWDDIVRAVDGGFVGLASEF